MTPQGLPKGEYKVFSQAGGVIPLEKDRVRCHNPESPTYKKFVFLEFLNKITHPATGEISKIEGREATVQRVNAELYVEPQ